MQISENGIVLIKQFEGLRLQSYLCSGNVWTIGWGATKIYGVKVIKGDNIQINEAEQLLKYDLKKFEDLVNSRIKTRITQNQFDTLVSHSYNTGGSDTLFDLINKRENIEEIREWFETRYITVQGKVIKGLINRRIEEANLFFLDKF